MRGAYTSDTPTRYICYRSHILELVAAKLASWPILVCQKMFVLMRSTCENVTVGELQWRCTKHDCAVASELLERVNSRNLGSVVCWQRLATFIEVCRSPSWLRPNKLWAMNTRIKHQTANAPKQTGTNNDSCRLKLLLLRRIFSIAFICAVHLSLLFGLQLLNALTLTFRLRFW